MQKQILDRVQICDPRVDKSLLSKIVNDICLPTPPVFKVILKTLKCDVSDIYTDSEINLKENGAAAPLPKPRYHDGRSHGENVYNLTVEIDRDVALRVFSKDGLRALGFLSATDAVRQYVDKLDKRLQRKTARQTDAAGGGNNKKTGGRE